MECSFKTIKPDEHKSKIFWKQRPRKPRNHRSLRELRKLLNQENSVFHGEQ